MSNTSTRNEEVLQELSSLRGIGVHISDAVVKAAEGDLSEYDNMSITDLVDLLIILHYEAK